jgi:hypothetical protein
MRVLHVNENPVLIIVRAQGTTANPKLIVLFFRG